ncbi:MAG: hypothetical protein ACREVV_12175 [Steroidobacteraceae bacterium]
MRAFLRLCLICVVALGAEGCASKSPQPLAEPSQSRVPDARPAASTGPVSGGAPAETVQCERTAEHGAAQPAASPGTAMSAGGADRLAKRSRSNRGSLNPGASNSEAGAGNSGGVGGHGRGVSGNGRGASGNGGGGNGATAIEKPDGSDDDIVARRLRKAAEQEPDPQLREKLWQEYIDYQRNTNQRNTNGI